MSYVAAGMQQLFDAARSSAPSSVVIVAGADAAEDFTGITGGYAITGTQSCMAPHMYRRLGNPESDWLARFGSSVRRTRSWSPRLARSIAQPTKRRV